MQEATSGAATGAGIASSPTAAEAGSIGPAQVDAKPAARLQDPVADLEQTVVKARAAAQPDAAAQVQPANESAAEAPADSSGSVVVPTTVQEGVGDETVQPVVSADTRVTDTEPQVKTDNTVSQQNTREATAVLERQPDAQQEWKVPKRLAKDERFEQIKEELRIKARQEGAAVDEKRIVQEAMRQYYSERAQEYLKRNGNQIPDEILNDKIYGKKYREVIEEMVGRGEGVTGENIGQAEKEALAQYLHEKDLKGMPLTLQILFGMVMAVGLGLPEVTQKLAAPQQQAA